MMIMIKACYLRSFLNSNVSRIFIAFCLFLFTFTFVSFIDKSNINYGKERKKCEPIIKKEVSAYKVNIDGVFYPHHLPLYANETINFDCLNNYNKFMFKAENHLK